MSNWLEGKVALVVGAGSGIGRGVLDAFLAEGATVAALERDPEKVASLKSELPEVPVVQGDATSHSANREAVDLVRESFGRLDSLVNCVGIFDYYKGIAEINNNELDSSFDEIFRTNVKSHMLSVKAALPALADGGSITLTESTSAYYPGRGGILYVPSKFAVRGFVKALGHELAPSIRVNAVAPGGTVGTDLRGLESLGLAEKSLGHTPNREEEIASRVPLQVALSPEDHAWSYVFLASDRARGISGDVIHSDGGMSIKG